MIALIRMARRAALGVGIAGSIAGILRMFGGGGMPPQSGGWRELAGPDLT